MKKLIYLVAAVVLSVTTVMAQPSKGEKEKGESAEGRASKRLERVSKLVTLSEKERSEVLDLFTQQEVSRESAKAEAAQEREKRKEARDAERTKNDDSLKAIIGTERFDTLEAANKRDHEKKQAQRDGHRKGGKREHKSSK